MAITYPRDLPATKFSTSHFQPVRFDSVNLLEGGATEGFETADPRWRALYVSRPIALDDIGTWESWNESLDGVLKRFLGYDTKRPFPRSYRPNGFTGINRAGGGAFNGTATVTALTASTIALSTLPANFALKVGDVVGLVQSGKYARYRILEDVTGSAGGVATVTVRPFVLTNIFTTAATANFDKPKCEMIVEPGSWDISPEGIFCRASWSGLQVLY
jgi:hypothetical protein